MNTINANKFLKSCKLLPIVLLLSLGLRNILKKTRGQVETTEIVLFFRPFYTTITMFLQVQKTTKD